MRERWDGDELFCLISIVFARIIGSKHSFLANLQIPISNELLGAISNAVLVALIFGLFYGPSPKRISKRIFFGAVLILSVVLVLAELL